MSQWTHVVGCIRVDGIPSIDPNGLGKVKAILGPISTFDEPRDDCTLPMGSEGSLEYRIIEYDTGCRWLAIVFWGDLRDYHSSAPIENWWETLLPQFSIVRDAVLRIEVEGSPPILLTNSREPMP